MTEVLVTGANGFVGSTLCSKLVERGDHVRALIRPTSDRALLDGIPAGIYEGSLEEPVSLQAATAGVEIVYHVAAAVSDWGPIEYFRRVNVEGTRRLLDACVLNRVQRFVYVSTVAVHSFIDAQDMDEESPQLPTPFPYCQSKREAESLVRSYHARGDLAITIIRPGDVFGPGDRVALLRLAPLLESGLTAVVGRGRKLGAFTYVENLADGLILAGTSEQAAGEAYVITDGIKLSWGEYLRRLTTALELPPPRLSLPPFAVSLAATLLESVYRLFGLRDRPPITLYLVTHLTNDFHFRIDKARRELGYEPGVDIDEAIRRTAAWYQEVVREKRPA